METAQDSESQQGFGDVDPFARPRFGADELQASLEAVRIAQAAARARARRDTRWARLIAAGALTAVGVTAWAAAHRPTKARAVATVPKAVAAPSVAPSITLPAPPPVAPSLAPAAPEATAPAERPAAAVAADSSGQVAACDDAFEQRSWIAVASTCAAAFEVRPNDSSLAMRVAQAQHRHGQLATAGDWARKALALDADIPEAYAIVAHAETGAGHSQAAVDAYRHYLALAPRGWHAAEARRALRAAR